MPSFHRRSTKIPLNPIYRRLLFCSRYESQSRWNRSRFCWVCWLDQRRLQWHRRGLPFFSWEALSTYGSSRKNASILFLIEEFSVAERICSQLNSTYLPTTWIHDTTTRKTPRVGLSGVGVWREEYKLETPNLSGRSVAERSGRGAETRDQKVEI